MGGLSIGIGIGLRYADFSPILKGNPNPPTYLSCFGTGIWENEGYWLNDDVWKGESTNPPFLPSGVWNNEGVYRYKDSFSFGSSFLPTGIFLFDLIYRYDDKIKVEYDISNAVLLEDGSPIKLDEGIGYIEKESENLGKSKSYWNF